MGKENMAYEGIITTKYNGQVFTIKGNDLEDIRSATTNALEEWKVFDLDLEYFINDDENTVISGEYKKGRTKRHKETKQYRRKKERKPKEYRSPRNCTNWKTEKWVKCLNNNKLYNTATEAAEELNLKADIIRKCCRNEGASTGKEHYRFQYVSKETNEPVPYRQTYKVITEEDRLEWKAKARKTIRERYARKVMCVETGEIYDSINEAMKVTGNTNIKYILSGKNKRESILHWVYVDQ